MFRDALRDAYRIALFEDPSARKRGGFVHIHSVRKHACRLLSISGREFDELVLELLENSPSGVEIRDVRLRPASYEPWRLIKVKGR